MSPAAKPVTTSGTRGSATASGSDVRIQVTNLVKTFKRQGGGGEVTPVDHVTLTVNAHEMVVLLGPSGCGKTTLLRCVAGLERPDSGEIVIGGEVVFSSERKIYVPANRRRASMIFQSYALWPHMTVFQNVAYPLEAKKIRGPKMRERVMQVLEMVDLQHLSNSHPAQISGGQQQRVALARAVVADSDVILFDEPLSNVDAKVRELLRLELLSMQRQLGFSGLYVTHDQTEAMAVADKIAVLSDGKISQLGAPQDIYHSPNSRYVGSFIGSANTLEGSISAVHTSTVTVESELGTLECSDIDLVAEKGLGIGDRVLVMSRPEKALVGADQPHVVNRWRARVETHLFLGSHSEYLVRCQGVGIRVWTNERQTIDEGAELWLSLDPSALRVLPEARPDEADPLAVDGG